jgi:hypothetical protein
MSPYLRIGALRDIKLPLRYWLQPLFRSTPRPNEKLRRLGARRLRRTSELWNNLRLADFRERDAQFASVLLDEYLPVSPTYQPALPGTPSGDGRERSDFDDGAGEAVEIGWAFERPIEAR